MNKSKTAYWEFTIKKVVLLAAVLSIFGCSGSEGDKLGKQTKILYEAVDRNDTARLHIQLGEKAFDGQLEISYNSLYKDSGDVNGIIKGDTLKGTYYFQHYGIPNGKEFQLLC